MTKKERASLIKKNLDKYFPDPPIPLKYTNTFTLLIAVLLSAQSTDNIVNTVTPLLFKKAKTPQKMKDLPIKTIETIIRPCGLAPTKSKAIHNLSKMLIEEYGGKVPNTFEDLEKLPGVGHKTASVVMAMAFHIPALPVDTHIFRCAKRWGLSRGKTVAQVEKDLKKLFPKDQWILLHLQIIYFARKFCPAKNHDKNQCPICSKLLKR